MTVQTVLTVLHSSNGTDIIFTFGLRSPITRAGPAMAGQVVVICAFETMVLTVLHSSDGTDGSDIVTQQWRYRCNGYLWTPLPYHTCRYGYGMSGGSYLRIWYHGLTVLHSSDSIDGSDIVTQQWRYRCNIYPWSPIPCHTCRSGYGRLGGSYLRIWYHGSDILS